MCLTWLLGFKVANISLNGRWLDATGVAKPNDPDPSVAGNLARHSQHNCTTGERR
jgi:hypothetical protein